MIETGGIKNVVIFIQAIFLITMYFFGGRGRIHDAFESGILSMKVEGTGFSDLATRDQVLDLPLFLFLFWYSNLKILTPKQTSEYLLKEIWKIIYYLYRAKKITKKVYNNIINSMNFKNSKRTDPHRVLLNLTGKINFKRND